MSNSTQQTQDQALREEVSAWYHQQALEVPPEKLDQDILRLSQTHLAEMNIAKLKPPVAPLWQRFPWAFSSAASLVIVLGLLVLNRPQVDRELMTPSAVMMGAPTASPAAEAELNTAEAKNAQIEHQAKMMQAEVAESRAMKAESRMLAQEQAQSVARKTSPMVTSQASPQPHLAATPNVDDAQAKPSSLAESLAHLKVLIESKQIDEALALEQKLLNEYPALSEAGVGDNSPEGIETPRATFKALQRQLHQGSQ
ncbi:hypothetical protein [Shewanella sp. CG12_big_fil_rev_8_21_14_0_65_47_15]|uniref:hypothetical protein n=1 Tax=Shewanella sp. CG12_big_fil_rev_8_21_14_0_65_47_15 TaxID=1975537 RepID=UPI000CB4857C|nr:hypothetical protein [Shewanella sp. CG12_big_fil_rev_8_21_14_0_65_47_15]PIW61026.1 MAG: hypothetical protein COW15_09920 [Shewanella sp. CG12_big_fil_rev_8_21_14_0_65_47_15]